MLEINNTSVSPKIYQLIATLGWGLPAIDWTLRANQSTKTMLEEEDAVLFTPHPIQDETMATAVRAMLYLWAGWSNHCNMWAAALPDKERLYISALAQRQMGNPEESKALFQQLEGHPFFDKLANLAKELISDASDKRMKKFRDLVQLGQAWEPFAFIDLLEEARTGKFSHTNEEIVRKLQWQEFNMLLCHCYKAATGVDIAKREESVQRAEATPAWKKNLPPASLRRPSPPIKKPEQDGCASQAPKDKNKKISNNKATEAPTEQPKPQPPQNLRIKCPKCGNVASYSTSFRGKKVACLKCRTAFQLAA